MVNLKYNTDYHAQGVQKVHQGFITPKFEIEKIRNNTECYHRRVAK